MSSALFVIPEIGGGKYWIVNISFRFSFHSSFRPSLRSSARPLIHPSVNSFFMTWGKDAKQKKKMSGWTSGPYLLFLSHSSFSCNKVLSNIWHAIS